MNSDRSLRANCKARFAEAFVDLRKDMLTRSFMLIVDKESVKIISSYLRQQDLLKFGIWGTESLQKSRKPYPSVEAVYYISPTEESTRKLSADYSADSKQYGAVHILFSSMVSKDVLKIIADNKYLVGLVKSCKEYNIDFLCSLDRHFSLNIPEAMIPLIQQGESFSLFQNKLLQKLSTCVTCFPKLFSFQIIYYQSPSKVAETVARKLAIKLEEQLKVYEKQKSEILDRGAKRINIIVIDRMADVMAPLLRDIHYQPMLYDLLQGKGNDSIQVNGKLTTLEQSDQTFMKYRTQHIAKLLEAIDQEVRSFKEKNPTAKMALEEKVDLAEVVKSYPQYVAKRKEIDLHISLAKGLLDKFYKGQTKELYILEHTLATGKDFNDEEYKEKKILSQIQALLKDPKNKFSAVDKARLVSSLHFCMSLSVTDSQEMISLCGKKYQTLFKTIKRLGNKPSQKSVKRPPYRPSDNKSLQYQTPKLLIPQFVRNVMNGDMSQAKSIKINWEDKSSAGGLSLFKGKFSKQKSEEFVLGMIGPLGYNEMVALPTNVITGGTTLESPSQYLEHLISLQSKQRVLDK